MKTRGRIKPMLATLIDEPFDDEDWIFEIKWDGFRALAEIHENQIDLYSRNLLPFNGKFPSIVSDLKKLKIDDALFDGEIVVVDKKGRSSFQLIQNYQSGLAPESALFYYVFDILFYEGKNLCKSPLIERKSLLKQLLKKSGHSIRYSDHIEKSGNQFFKQCVKLKLEGMVAKQKSSPYLIATRSKKWLKIKSLQRQEFVVCGFTEPKGSRKNFGSLIIGFYEKKELKFAGHVGGGFSENDLITLRKKFAPFIQKTCPFKKCPKKCAKKCAKTNAAVTWLKPHFVCEVSFNEWTKEGILRQPIFLGLREDKSPKQVKKEY